MKKKTIMIASLLAAGAIGTAGYTASAKFEQAAAGQKDIIRIIEEKYDGHIKEMELEQDGGQPKYEVAYTKGNAEYEVEIDANDGRVIQKAERDDDDRDGRAPAKNTDKNGEILSLQQAVDIAKQHYAGKVAEAELDENDGRRIYEIEIETNRGEVELEIDAKTGKILDVEWDD